MFCQICGIDVSSTTTKCPKCGGSIFVDENPPDNGEKPKQKEIEILTPLVPQSVGWMGMLCLVYSMFALAFRGGFIQSWISLIISAFLIDRQRRINKQNNIKIRRVKYMIVCYVMFGLVVVRNSLMALAWLCGDQQRVGSDSQYENPIDSSERATPLSFCGINFGEKIDLRFPNAEFEDNSKSRTYEFSNFVSGFKLGKPFRNFKEGKVFATMTSKKIYKVELVYYFPREVSAAVDDAEYQGTLQALQTKYGVNCTEEIGWGGDKTNVFKVGNVLITLRFVTEGVVDRGHLILTAENIKVRAIAEAECQKYYQERSRRDVENMNGFQNGGVDVL